MNWTESDPLGICIYDSSPAYRTIGGQVICEGCFPIAYEQWFHTDRLPEHEDYSSGYRAGSLVGTLHQLLEILGWDSWSEPNSMWQVGFLRGYQDRAQPEVDL